MGKPLRQAPPNVVLPPAELVWPLRKDGEGRVPHGGEFAGGTVNAEASCRLPLQGLPDAVLVRDALLAEGVASRPQVPSNHFSSPASSFL